MYMETNRKRSRCLGGATEISSVLLLHGGGRGGGGNEGEEEEKVEAEEREEPDEENVGIQTGLLKQKWWAASKATSGIRQSEPTVAQTCWEIKRCFIYIFFALVICKTKANKVVKSTTDTVLYSSVWTPM